MVELGVPTRIIPVDADLTRPLALALVLLVAAPLLLLAQSVAGFIDPMPTARLKQLFPSAVAFTPRGEKDPIYFTAYAADPSEVAGRQADRWAFWTIDLVPRNSDITGTFTC